VANENGRGIRSVAQRKVSAVDLVLHEIRRSILNGDLPPGRPFTVPALTERLGVSHVPVREALRQLEAQGLVTLSPSRSATVTPLDPDDVRSIYRLRIRLEPELAALSAAKRPDRHADELDDLVRAMFDAPLGEEQLDIHREFHTALIRPAASKWDLRLLGPLWDAAERYSRLVFDPVEWTDARAADRRRAHEDLVTASRSEDPTMVENELRHHLESNLETILQRLSPIAYPDIASWLAQEVDRRTP
jgi:DNA-binding GntR family transcriptional regulator